MVFTHRELGAQGTKRCKISPKACRTQLPAKIVRKTRLGQHFRRIWCSLARQLASFWSLLGGCWPLLGASRASLGHFLGALGCLLAGLGDFRAAFWVPGLAQASILEGRGTSQTAFWQVFQALSACFLLHLALGRLLAASCASWALPSLTLVYAGASGLRFWSVLLPWEIHITGLRNTLSVLVMHVCPQLFFALPCPIATTDSAMRSRQFDTIQRSFSAACCISWV